jgi:HD-like signal output (HDOD) protein
MFKSLLKTIFPSVFSEKNTPNYEYFQQTGNIEFDKEISITDLSGLFFSDEYDSKEKIKSSDSHNYNKLFNDLLFGDDIEEHSTKIDPLSEYVAAQIKELLIRPQNLISELPIMPASVDAVLTALNSKNFNVDDILNIIAKEPSMAADMIKLANSTKYRRSKSPIVNLKSAFMVMGAQGLLTGVVYVFINNFTPKNTRYFKNFGTKIWQHCLQTALISKDLADKNPSVENASAAYLIGLLRNLGEMIIFDLMVEAFHHVDPSSTPNSQSFKALISHHAISLTVAIVSKWNLPPIVITTIKQQDNKQLEQSPLESLIEQANFISKLKILHNYKKINHEAYELACLKLKSEQAQTYALNELIIATE